MPNVVENPNLNNALEHRVGADLHDWEYNNTVNENDFVTNIFKCINTLYDTCVNNQKADCDIKRVGGKMSDFKRDLNFNNYYGLSFNAYVLKYPLKNTFFFNNLFIHRLNRLSRNKRKYITDVSNSTTFTIDDTPNRPDVFKHRLLMFIDGKLFNDLVLYTNTEYVLLVIDPDRTGITMKQIMDYCDTKNDYRWTLLGVSFTTTKKYYGLRSSVLTGTDLSVESFNDVTSRIIDKNYWLCAMATSIVNATDRDGNAYADNRSIMNFTFVGDISNDHIVDVSSIGTKTIEDVNKHTYLSSEIINIPNVIAMLDIGTSRIFQFGCDEKYPSPIPPENMIAFKYDELNGYRLIHMCNESIPAKGTKITGDLDNDMFLTDRDVDIFNNYLNGINDNRLVNKNNMDLTHDQTVDENDLRELESLVAQSNVKSITHYFPNVYKLNGFDPKDDIRILVMYGKNDRTKFRNPIFEYMQYNRNYANEVVSGVLPKSIQKYIPTENMYTEVNYLQYHSEATRNIEYEYKFETLKEFIHDDYQRLTDMYVDYITKNNNNFYSNSKYIFDMKKQYDNFEKYSTDNGDYYKLIINVPDSRRFYVSLWIDGVYSQTTNVTHKPFKTIITFSSINVTKDSIIIIELHKVKYDEPNTINITLPAINDSIELPRGNFEDVSPQSLMFGIKKDLPGSDGTVEERYELASNYEMYWLLIGHHQYINGTCVNYNGEKSAELPGTSIIMDNDNNVLLEQGVNFDVKDQTEYDPDVVNIALVGNINDVVEGDKNFLLERGNENYVYVKTDENATTSDDAVAMRNQGYYGKDRRRFYYYMPYGKDDPDIFITPITNYFANEMVVIKNTDVYSNRVFLTSPNEVTGNQEFIYKKFGLDPNPGKYRLFANGKLLDYGYDYVTDINIDSGWYIDSDIKFTLLKIKEPVRVTFEYIPYRYNLLYRNKEYDGIVTLRDNCTRPFDTRFYDVYVDGYLLSSKDINVVSPTKFTIPSIVNDDGKSGHILSIYEKAHDADIFDFVWRDEDDKYNSTVKTIAGTRKAVKVGSGIIDALIDQDINFKKYMLPDWNEAKANKESNLGFGVGK